MTKMTFAQESGNTNQSHSTNRIPDIPPDDQSGDEGYEKNVPLSFLTTGSVWKTEDILEFTNKGREFLSDGLEEEGDGAWGGLPISNTLSNTPPRSSMYMELPDNESSNEMILGENIQAPLYQERDGLPDDLNLTDMPREKKPKSQKKDLRNDQLVADYMTAKELFNPMEIIHWDDSQLLPSMLRHSHILGMSPAECYLHVTRIKSDQESKDALGFIQAHIIDLKDRMIDIDEKISAIGEKLKQKHQPVDEVIHPIRELVAQVAEIKRTNATVVSGVSTLQHMMRTPRNFACLLPDSNPSMPYEPVIKDAIISKKQTIGRKPNDRPEDRIDFSKPSKNLTKLEKLQLLKQKSNKTSRDTSPGSGVESEKSYASSNVVGHLKKVSSIPDYSPSTSTHKIEPIPKNPLQKVEVNTMKQNKDIFRSAHFVKLGQAGIAIQSIEKNQALLQHLNIKSLDTLIKWLKEYSKNDWDSLREKMIESFSKKTGEEVKALQLYNIATFSDSSESALQYMMALREAKLALSN